MALARLAEPRRQRLLDAALARGPGRAGRHPAHGRLRSRRRAGRPVDLGPPSRSKGRARPLDRSAAAEPGAGRRDARAPGPDPGDGRVHGCRRRRADPPVARLPRRGDPPAGGALARRHGGDRRSHRCGRLGHPDPGAPARCAERARYRPRSAHLGGAGRPAAGLGPRGDRRLLGGGRLDRGMAGSKARVLGRPRRRGAAGGARRRLLAARRARAEPAPRLGRARPRRPRPRSGRAGGAAPPAPAGAGRLRGRRGRCPGARRRDHSRGGLAHPGAGRRASGHGLGGAATSSFSSFAGPRAGSRPSSWSAPASASIRDFSTPGGAPSPPFGPAAAPCC